MTHTISVSERTYDLLRQRAQQTQTSPDLLAEDVLRTHLGHEDLLWRQSLEALIARVQARIAQFGSDEIEADITVAAAEARELRRARHGGS